jgi:2-dehydropantoate 2-reductase
MRFIVYGVGAIGGTIAASLVLAGYEVIGIARGRMLEAIRDRGLHFRTPLIDERVRFECVGSPSELALRDDDVIILTMKSQDTHGALEALASAGADRQAIVCGQNGVANERTALRYFPNVYGMTVMCPGTYTEPGEVLCHARPKRGMLDIGRYPSGRDDLAEKIAAALAKAEFRTEVFDDIMLSKYGKLIENQGNIVRATLGYKTDTSPFDQTLRAEAWAVLTAAGIKWMEIGGRDDRRKGVMEPGEIAGTTRGGDSSSQSLMRGTGSLETDFLNGEIAYLGRLHGVPTPASDFVCRLARRILRENLKPGAISPEEFARGLAGT